MQSAIVAREVGLDNKIANKRAKRYIFYPISDIDLSGTQATSPVWKPKIPKSRIVLLEPLEYYTQAGEEVQVYASGGVKLELAEMGTDAQVRFLLDTFGEKGLVAIESLTNVEANIAVKVEALIYPNMESVPATLVALETHLASLVFNSEDALEELASNVVKELLEGVGRAIAWANLWCNGIERELQSSRAGRAGRPSMTNTDRYYYAQIGRRTPRDNDLNFGGSQDDGLAGKLVELLGQQTNPMELEAYQSTIKKKTALLLNYLLTVKPQNNGY